MSTAVVRYVGEEVKRERKAVVVDQALEAIYKRHKTITADLILAAAANAKHPLHEYFEWDDSVAAQKFRRCQAYALVLASKFTVQLIQNGELEQPRIKESARVRKLVSAFKGEGFRLRRDALADAQMRSAIIETKKSALRSWCNSTIDIEELQPLRKLILQNL